MSRVAIVKKRFISSETNTIAKASLLTCQFSTPRFLYLAGSQAAISVSCIPRDVSSINVRTGSRRFDTKVSLTCGRICNVELRVCVMLMNSTGVAWAAF